MVRKGKLEFIEKNKGIKKVIEVELNKDIEDQLAYYLRDIIEIIEGEEVPKFLNSNTCKKCAYYEYCYI